MEDPYRPANITELSALVQVCAIFAWLHRDTKCVTVLHNLAFKNLLLLVQILMVFKVYPG